MHTVASFVLLFSLAAAQTCPSNATAANATQAAANAWIYGNPPLQFYQTRTAALQPGTNQTINKFSHARRLATAAERSIVKPNADTTYSSAWLDLSAGPVTFYLPNVTDRYFVAAMYDAYSNNFHNPGNLLGSPSGNYTLYGPRYASCANASSPFDIVSPTDDMWILGRIYVLNTTGTADYDIVNRIQDQLQVVKAPTLPSQPILQPSFSSGTPQVLQSYYLLNEAIKNNPVDPAAYRANFTSVGLSPDRPFVPLLTTQQLNASQAAANGTIAGAPLLGGFLKGLSNSWLLPAQKKFANFGTDYITRAYIANTGFGALVPEQAIYPTRLGALTSTNTSRHVIFFPDGEPPSRALGFWSLTAYDSDNYFVKNAIDRYSLGSRDNLRQLASGGNGSFSIVASVNPPAEGIMNWLPVPLGPWIVTLRVYGATSAIADGQYTMPSITLSS
ncbi:hypothetical protein BCR37DRAFT_405350 [Protomyces lactucae-debilis]|uniref:DUF1254 domain-containing protein n=1 Tax=Protomyces lactucae-debilis TaxID=2754530 RepID=A0A1Y2F4X4_PROLT|nr:uncharacterized protein BCR37DRAFT_405350 [Protomyces lactucae-debilis]ORY78534.1 hypothetical protein BCR37DRAFT_405350 [Protomyces lactucae-debilis]